MTWKTFGKRFKKLVAGLRHAFDATYSTLPTTTELQQNQAEIDHLLQCLTTFTDPIPLCLYDLEGEMLSRPEYEEAVRIMEREFWAAMSAHEWEKPIPTVGEVARRQRAALLKPAAGGR